MANNTNTDGKTSTDGVGVTETQKNKRTYRAFAIKNHEVICEIDVAPFSESRLDQLCQKEGFDGWIYLSPKTALVLMQVRGEN